MQPKVMVMHDSSGQLAGNVVLTSGGGGGLGAKYVLGQ